MLLHVYFEKCWCPSEQNFSEGFFLINKLNNWLDMKKEIKVAANVFKYMNKLTGIVNRSFDGNYTARTSIIQYTL